MFCLIESMEDTDGKYRGFLSEYDADFHFQRCARLSTTFDTPNKGFEGLAYLRRGGDEYILATCEGNLCVARCDGRASLTLGEALAVTYLDVGCLGVRTLPTHGFGGNSACSHEIRTAAQR